MVETKIPDKINFGKPIAVVETLKILVSALLNGQTNFLVQSGIVKDTNSISINCFCEPKSVGILLGRKESGLTAPTKWSILRLLNIIAYNSGISQVNLLINDYSKIPAPDGVESEVKDEKAKV